MIDEFIGLGAALAIEHPEQAEYSVSPEGSMLHISAPSGFTVRLALDYVGVRLWVSFLVDALVDTGEPAKAAVVQAALAEAAKRAVNQ